MVLANVVPSWYLYSDILISQYFPLGTSIWGDSSILNFRVIKIRRLLIHHQWGPWGTLQWRHDERDGVSNYRRLDCLLNRLFSDILLRLDISYYHILSSITYVSREHWDPVSITDVQSMVFANNRMHYDLYVAFVCLQITPSHYHHYADLSEGIELLKWLSGICCQVCV